METDRLNIDAMREGLEAVPTRTRENVKKKGGELRETAREPVVR